MLRDIKKTYLIILRIHILFLIYRVIPVLLSRSPGGRILAQLLLDELVHSLLFLSCLLLFRFLPRHLFVFRLVGRPVFSAASTVALALRNELRL